MKTVRRIYNFLAPDGAAAQDWIDKIHHCIQWTASCNACLENSSAMRTPPSHLPSLSAIPRVWIQHFTVCLKLVFAFLRVNVSLDAINTGTGVGCYLAGCFLWDGRYVRNVVRSEFHNLRHDICSRVLFWKQEGQKYLVTYQCEKISRIVMRGTMMPGIWTINVRQDAGRKLCHNVFTLRGHFGLEQNFEGEQSSWKTKSWTTEPSVRIWKDTRAIQRRNVKRTSDLLCWMMMCVLYL